MHSLFTAAVTAKDETSAPIRFEYGGDESQFVLVHLPEGEAVVPTLVVIHGGFWKNKYTVHAAAHESIAPAVKSLGWGVVEVEYRRRDSVGGGWPGSKDDIVAAIDGTMASFPRLDGRRLVVLGHSAGGHGALMACAECSASPKACVAVRRAAPFVLEGGGLRGRGDCRRWRP